MFNGIPVLACSNCTSQYWFFVNESYIGMYVHKDRDIIMDDFERPRNQDVDSAMLFWAGNYGSSNNRYHGVFSALAG